MGSVHMGVGICFLAPNGVVEPHVHSFEESFYVLEGSVKVHIGDQRHVLSHGNFGFIPTGAAHSFLASERGAKWLEMQAPQPRPTDYGCDTFFVEQSVAGAGEARIGHFDDSQLPKPGGASQMDGFNPITG